MSRRRLLWLVAMAVVAAALVLSFAARRGAAGAPQLASIDAAALETFRADFNAASSQPRIIVLLSPT